MHAEGGKGHHGQHLPWPSRNSNMGKLGLSDVEDPRSTGRVRCGTWGRSAMADVEKGDVAALAIGEDAAAMVTRAWAEATPSASS